MVHQRNISNVTHPTNSRLYHTSIFIIYYRNFWDNSTSPHITPYE